MHKHIKKRKKKHFVICTASSNIHFFEFLDEFWVRKESRLIPELLQMMLELGTVKGLCRCYWLVVWCGIVCCEQGTGVGVGWK